MKKIHAIVPRWLPAILIMLAIFAFSSQTSSELPNYGGWDYFVKKSAHGIGYGLLSLSYLCALPNRNYKLAWFLALLYSLTDEFHQSFVPGRRASWIDVFVFDNLGAISALFFHYKLLCCKHSQNLSLRAKRSSPCQRKGLLRRLRRLAMTSLQQSNYKFLSIFWRQP